MTNENNTPQAQMMGSDEGLEALKDENQRLREALGDLMTWFPDEPSEPEWRFKGGSQGADDAVAAARAALGAATGEAS